MPTILLFRHGESQSNAGMPTLYPEDVALTDLGIDQARWIADYLALQIPPNLIVTSSYQRTRQTAVPTLLRFPRVPEEVWPVHEFTYLSRQEVLAPSTRQDRRPLVDVYWELCDPELVDGPGSESFEQFIARVRGVMRRFETLAGDKIVTIFSHEQFICAMYWLLERNPERITSEAMRDFKEFLMDHSISNGGFLQLERSSEYSPWRCELMLPLVAV